MALMQKELLTADDCLFCYPEPIGRKHQADCPLPRVFMYYQELKVLLTEKEKKLALALSVSHDRYKILEELEREQITIMEEQTATNRRYLEETKRRDAVIAEKEWLLEVARDALGTLSCLGNGERPGNSDGNIIAQKALSQIKAL